MYMRPQIGVVAALGLAACGHDGGNAGPACARTDQVPLSALQEMEAEIACAVSPEEGLVLRFVEAPDARADTCAPALILAGPAGFAAPRVELGVMSREGRYAGTSLAIRDFLFSDRLSNSTTLEIAPASACAEVSVSVEELACRASAQSETSPAGCGPVRFEGTDMFGAFTGPSGR
mgnify:CR=1 FL=1